ncbi:hypothetical protein [Curtobacterium sp. MCBD17_026]|uniref:hypothetical protein n=1 Tax=Curtobacterium sp. MCBD17_026 TaxID=2175621 RepID=UPI0011B462BB|nr:hypothetical protein [Curtobacterium sp. MCBD17_026]WIB69544.1 hypothetical protein DEI85_10220 [Curtobacterium sp. MCBD17_026]
MNQSCKYTFRRSAAIGAAIAIVTASSAFGIGASAASAATDETAAPSTTATSAPQNATTATTATTALDTTADDTGTDTAPDTAQPAPDGETADQAPVPAPAPAPTDETAAPDNTPTPTPAATAPPAADTTTTTPAAEQPGPEASTPVTWAEPSSKDAPIVLTATAGQPFSHTFTAQGGDGPLEYLFNPLNFFPNNDLNGWSWNEQTGVLSANPLSTIDGPALFEVTATDLHQTAVQYVQVDIEPGAPVGVTFGVDSSDSDVSWQVDADGTIREYAPGGTGDTVVSEVPATVGSSMTLAGLAVDALGNRTTPGDEYPRSTVTSTTASDGVVWDPDWSANTVTFSEPGTRTLTVSEGGVSTSFTVRVSEAPAPVAGITIGVLPADGTSGDRWGVEGDVITYYPADGDAQQVDAIPARQGARVQIRALAVDADGQPVGDHTDLAFTSDVASDRIEYDPDAAATWVTFEHASPHTITVASGDVTSTIRFEVQPTATTTVTTTHTPTASGTLAYTGADESGPLAWALGLLASGAGLLVWRLRRRLG